MEIPHRSKRLTLQETILDLRASPQSPPRKLQALVRLPPRTPRNCSQSPYQTLTIRNPQQYLRACAGHYAQDAPNLDHVPPNPNRSGASHSDSKNVRPCSLRTTGDPARSNLGALSRIREQKGCTHRDLA